MFFIKPPKINIQNLSMCILWDKKSKTFSYPENKYSNADTFVSDYLYGTTFTYNILNIDTITFGRFKGKNIEDVLKERKYQRVCC